MPIPRVDFVYLPRPDKSASIYLSCEVILWAESGEIISQTAERARDARVKYFVHNDRLHEVGKWSDTGYVLKP